jgi:hypothetical protein
MDLIIILFSIRAIETCYTYHKTEFFHSNLILSTIPSNQSEVPQDE